MKKSYIPSDDLVPRIVAGERWAVARLISRAEAGVQEARPALGEVYRRAGRAQVIGITGVPGSGKSTMVAQLVKKLRAEGKRVGVVAIDPSSPYSGGSILGDRIRMSDLALDEHVFVRSMATHGAVGGMAHAALDVVDVLDMAGFEVIIIETVGVGQDEVEIANASHSTVVVSAPGLGDEVQAIKAGILEIADVHVVSKCDRSDANRTITDLKMMLKDGLTHDRIGGWIPPVVGVSSYNASGFDELVEALSRHHALLDTPEGRARREGIAQFRLTKASETLVLEGFRAAQSDNIASSRKALAARESDPYSAAEALVHAYAGEAKR
ncbi:methylmalonyl Co-A mutase-associated GTPase MeaB [Brevirhabdus sp.]|uniref:methylmalonyl Co-A mutase-associated GTPase MeaB n=1 Tax=Brevirhabdus sp. TaxID=2004514 RepID=UPI004057EFB6